MTQNNYEKFNKLNFDFFETAKSTLLDPLGIDISNDVKWIKIREKWAKNGRDRIKKLKLSPYNQAEKIHLILQS